MDKNDLISRSELLERLKENRPLNWGDTDEEIQAVEDFNFFTSVVKNAPAVDPEELRPKGHWEWYEEKHGNPIDGVDYDYGYRCSNCAYKLLDDYADPAYQPEVYYCPNCEAMMEG